LRPETIRTIDVPAVAMSAMLRRVRRRIIIVMGASGAEKRAAEANQHEGHIDETKFDAIQNSHPNDGFPEPPPYCRAPAVLIIRR
jgi:2',3'-cyclic-nucleotide 2'-phosphodiesterase (5'-nucleotidase family)